MPLFCDIDASTGQVGLYEPVVSSEILFNTFILTEGPLEDICRSVADEWNMKHPGDGMIVKPEIECDNTGTSYNIRFCIELPGESQFLYVKPFGRETFYRTVRGIEKDNFIERIQRHTSYNHTKTGLSTAIIVVKVFEKIAERYGIRLLY